MNWFIDNDVGLDYGVKSLMRYSRRADGTDAMSNVCNFPISEFLWVLPLYPAVFYPLYESFLILYWILFNNLCNLKIELGRAKNLWVFRLAMMSSKNLCLDFWDVCPWFCMLSLSKLCVFYFLFFCCPSAFTMRLLGFESY